MSLRHKKSRDSNHASIQSSLEKCGISVADLSGNGGGCPDIATYWNGQTVWIEIKVGTGSHVENSQLKFFSKWKGYCGIAQNFEQALAMAKYPNQHVLTSAEKLKISQHLVKFPSDRITVKRFYEVIGREN